MKDEADKSLNAHLKLYRLNLGTQRAFSKGTLMTCKNKFLQLPERSRSTANCQHHTL